MSTLYTVYTYGNGHLVAEVFNAVAMMVGDKSYISVLRLAALCAFAWVLLTVVLKMEPIVMLRWFAGFYFLLNVLIVPKMSVAIEDRLDAPLTQVVDHVPAGLVVFASLTSRIGDSLAQLFDKVFALPDDLQYAKTGYLMGARLAQTLGTMRVTDATFTSNLSRYVKQCVFYDVLLGKYTVKDLYQSSDVWGFVTANASPARAFLYQAENHQEILTCQAGVIRLNQTWSKELNQSATLWGKHLFGANTLNPKALFLSRLPVALGYLTKLSSLTSEKVMQQAMMGDLLRTAVSDYGAQTGSAAAVTRFANARGNNLLRSKFKIVGNEAATWLSTMFNVINVLLYGSFLLIALLLALPMGGQVVKYYVQALLWVQCWPPLYAILNLVMTYSAQSKSLAAVSTLGAPVLNLNTTTGLALVNADMAAYAGYATMLIPFLAWGLVSKGSLAVTALASNVAGLATQAAARASEEATTGNYNFGNLSLDNQTAFNTSRNHFNSNASVQQGMSTVQAADGALLHYTQDGGSVVDARGAISSLGTSINYADAIRSSSMEQSDKALTEGLNQSHQYGEQVSGVLRQLYEVGQHVGHTFSHDNSASLSTSSQFADSLEAYSQRVDEFAHSHGLTTAQAAKVLGQVYAGGELYGQSPKFFKMRVKGELGGKVSFEGMTDAQRNQVYNDAHRFTELHSFRNVVDSVQRAAQDEQLRSNIDNGERIMDNLGTSFEQAANLRQDAVAHLQDAASYREAASFASDHASSINVNMGQQFVEWVAEQPGATGHAMGVAQAETLITQHPEVARSLANDFVQFETSRLAATYHEEGQSPEAIQGAFAQHTKALGGNGLVEQAQAAMKQRVMNQAASTPLAKASSHERPVTDLVQQQFNEAQTRLLEERLNDEAQDYSDKGYAKFATDPSRHDLGRHALRDAKTSVKDFFNIGESDHS